MSAQHTPGPWKPHVNLKNCKITANGLRLAKITPGNWSRDEDVANCRLLAAAPDLLKACSNIANEIEHWESEQSPTLEMMDGCVQELRAAIAKAKEGK